jgi:peptidyl-prolyl cis-trans isomerase D
MLGWMRKQTRSWFVYIAFGIIIVVFIFLYGFPQKGQREGTFVAKVNNQKITRRQHDELYENMLMFSRNLYKRSLTEKEIKQLRQRALDNLVEQALVIQEAARLGLEVSPEEVKREIAYTPLFQSEGMFNREIYLRQLSARRMTPGEYERAVGTEMLVSKLVGVVKNTTKLSDKELYERYRLESEKINLRFLKLDTSDFEDEAEVSEEEIVAHYEKTRENYRTPARVKVRYLSFEPKQYRETVEIKPEETEGFYRVNEDRFMQEKKIRARHILIEVKKGGGDQAEGGAQKKAEDIRKKIEEGEDFSQLAKKLSQDTASAAKGGDLGYFARGQMVKGFDDAAFSLKPGEVSPVVKTPLGFHLIKVEDIREGGPEPLEKVRGVIEEELRDEKAEARSGEEASLAIGRIYRSGDMAGYAKEHGLGVQETGFFSKGEPTREFGINEDVSDAALLLKAGEISPIIRLGEKYLILQLVERKEPHVPDLEEVEAKVKKAVRREKAKKAARGKAERLLSELASGTTMDQTAKRERLIPEETGLFTRGSAYIHKIGSSEELLREAFSLTPEKPLPGKVYGIKDTYYLVQLKEKVGADREKFQAEKEKLRERLLAQKREERVKLWIKSLKEKAAIEMALTI